MFRVCRHLMVLPSKNSFTNSVATFQSATSKRIISSAYQGTPVSITGPPPVPPPPELCCRSGCQNCVWLEYINDMLHYYKDNKQEASKALDAIPDETMKTFIRIELGL